MLIKINRFYLEGYKKHIGYRLVVYEDGGYWADVEPRLIKKYLMERL